MRTVHTLRVLIVAKTHMQRYACIGGMSLDPDRSLRLMQANGSPQPGDTPYEIGDIWQIECEAPAEIRPPHVEDVNVLRAYKIGEERGAALPAGAYLPLRGALTHTFEELVPSPTTGRLHHDIMGVPGMSPGSGGRQPLQKVVDKKCTTVPRDRGRAAPILGYAPAADLIPANTLVRLSLAACVSRRRHRRGSAGYLQLSGWYL